jgi:hypothetical protein
LEQGNLLQTPSRSASASDEVIYAQVTSATGNRYEWAERIPVDGGGWEESSRTSTTPVADPAYEVDANVVRTFPFMAILSRDSHAGNRLFFQAPFFQGQG